MKRTTRTVTGRWGRVALLGGVALFGGVAFAGSAGAAQSAALRGIERGSEPLEVRIRLDRGVDPVLQKGEEVRVYLWASRDAYLAVFRVDPDGRVRLVLPAGPLDAHRVDAGRDYQLPGGWVVEGQPGIGYYFVLASSNPFDFGRLKAAEGTSEWELARAGIRIRQDPHLAMEGLAELLTANRVGTPDTALDFTAYHVGQTFSYPRFLCYECHETQSFEAWNPYLQACPSVRVVISSDPYFYPTTRYQGVRPAFPNPPAPGLAQYAFRARQAGEAGTPVVIARGSDAPGSQVPSPNVRAMGFREEMLDLLGRSGAAIPGLDAGSAVPPGPVPTAATGTLDPRLPAVLNPASAEPAGRPTLQRRVDQRGDPQP